jgi:hypothetical protein
MMMFSTSLSMMGMILIWKLDADNKGGRLTGLTFGGVFAVNIPLSLSLVSSNVAGFTKRSVISALIFVAYCVGNIVGPQFYLAEEEPDYPVSLNPDFHFTSNTNTTDRPESKQPCAVSSWVFSSYSA